MIKLNPEELMVMAGTASIEKGGYASQEASMAQQLSGGATKGQQIATTRTV